MIEFKWLIFFVVKTSFYHGSQNQRNLFFPIIQIVSILINYKLSLITSINCFNGDHITSRRRNSNFHSVRSGRAVS